MPQKILTISIAAYNVESYIGKTLDSLMCKKEWLDKLEIFVVDDESTDETAIIAKRYEKRYPQSIHVIHKKNGGHGSTLNYSIRHATGKYFRMLDGDDWYDTISLEKHLQKLTNEDADLVLTPYKRVTTKETTEVNRHYFKYGRKYELAGKTYDLLENLHAAEATIRTSLLQDNNVYLPENCSFSDDAFVSYMILYANSVIKYETNVYRYRIGVEGQSISNIGRIRHKKDGFRVVEDVVRNISGFLKKQDIQKKQAIYNILCNTLEFQYDTLLLLDDLDDVKTIMKEETTKLYAYNNDFMKYFSNNSWLNFFLGELLFKVPMLRLEENAPIIIVGAGKYGELAVQILMRQEIRPCYVCDNNRERQGTKLQDVEIVSVERAIKVKNAFFFIAVKSDGMILRKQLIDKNVMECKIIYNS